MSAHAEKHDTGHEKHDAHGKKPELSLVKDAHAEIKAPQHETAHAVKKAADTHGHGAHHDTHAEKHGHDAHDAGHKPDAAHGAHHDTSTMHADAPPTGLFAKMGYYWKKGWSLLKELFAD